MKITRTTKSANEAIKVSLFETHSLFKTYDFTADKFEDKLIEQTYITNMCERKYKYIPKNVAEKIFKVASFNITNGKRNFIIRIDGGIYIGALSELATIKANLEEYIKEYENYSCYSKIEIEL